MGADQQHSLLLPSPLPSRQPLQRSNRGKAVISLSALAASAESSAHHQTGLALLLVAPLLSRRPSNLHQVVKVALARSAG